MVRVPIVGLWQVRGAHLKDRKFWGSRQAMA